MNGWVRLEHHPDHDWLDRVVIDPVRQGEGHGTAVLQRLQAEADHRGVPLWLSVYRANAACCLYLRLEFGAIGRDAERVFMVWPDHPELVPPR